MECIGLALAIPPLLAGLFRVMKYVNDAQAKFNAVPTVMASLLAQCTAMHIVLGRLQYLDLARAMPDEGEQVRFLQSIEAIISGCRSTLSRLEGFLLESGQTEGDGLDKSSPEIGSKARIAFMRQEGQIKELLTQLSSYHSSILVILATAQT